MMKLLPDPPPPLSTLRVLLLLWCCCCAGLARAQNCVATALSVIPSCAQNCIVSGATAVGCGGTDFGCQCQKTAALFAAVDGCVAAACPSASYQAVIDGASTVCGCASPTVVAGAAGTASVSGISGISGIPWTTPASNTATATATATSLVTTTTASSSGTVLTGSPSSSATGSGGESGAQGNGATWTGYTSVAPVATASAIGAAARPQAATLGGDMLRYVVVPVVMVVAGAL